VSTICETPEAHFSTKVKVISFRSPFINCFILRFITKAELMGAMLLVHSRSWLLYLHHDKLILLAISIQPIHYFGEIRFYYGFGVHRLVSLKTSHFGGISV
jgi:hypothetical protein